MKVRFPLLIPCKMLGKWAPESLCTLVRVAPIGRRFL